ncbi:50S ribosomal protein L15e [Candidatus Woesearchaeota archaeon]|nr:50S ribosomal protein L15e [Candidatus Woesearchaeota archaeon]
MGYLKYIKNLYKDPKSSLGDLYKQRLVQFRKESTVTRLDNPTRIDKARSLGYKAKKGFIAVRVRVKRGGKMRPHFMGGRKPKKSRRRKVTERNYRWIAEEKAARLHNNCEVLGSYEIAKDGMHYWFEVILGDREILKAYPGYKWISTNPGRVFRGTTSANKA